MSKNMSRYGAEEAIKMAAASQSIDDFEYQPSMHARIEVKAAKMAEITALLDAAKAAGKSPDEVEIPPLDIDDHDLVICMSVNQVRTLRIIDKKVAARTVWPDCELLRKPLREVMERSQLAFDGGPGKANA